MLVSLDVYRYLKAFASSVPANDVGLPPPAKEQQMRPPPIQQAA
jgi:hypothetical protein